MTSVERMKIWRLNNPEKVKEQNRRWKEKNPEKSKEIRHRAEKKYREKNREKLKERRRQRNKENPIPARSRTLKYKYGITQEQFDVMLLDQNNRCKLCKELFIDEIPYVDHSHKSGLVRGLLHRACNTAIGLLNENVKKCRLAAIYLESFQLEQNNDNL
jgi:recombination endonuclease VII